MQAVQKQLALRVIKVLLLGTLLRVTVLVSVASSGAASLSDAEYRHRIVGVWGDEYQGHRVLTLRADGTATMVVQLHGWKAALYASRLQFEMTWSIEEARLKKRTTGGEPAGKIKAILKLMGDRVEERILELTPDRLLLLDQNGKRQYDWRRVKAVE